MPYEHGAGVRDHRHLTWEETEHQSRRYWDHVKGESPRYQLYSNATHDFQNFAFLFTLEWEKETMAEAYIVDSYDITHNKLRT